MASTATAFLCECFRLSASELEDVIKQYDIKTLEDLQARNCAGLGCGGCLEELEKRLKRAAEWPEGRRVDLL